MKYRVTLQNNDISSPDRVVELIAVSAINAKEIGTMRYGKKGFTASKAIRIGQAPATVKVMEDIREDFINAMDEGNKEIARQQEKAFYSTLAQIQNEMDVVAFSMAKKHLPELPPLGK